MTGTIIMFHPSRMFGFIRSDQDGKDYFYHGSNLMRGTAPVVGTRVTFELVPPVKLGKPPQAASVTAVESAVKAGA